MDSMDMTSYCYGLELDSTNKLASQPDKISMKLKPHQLTSLNKAIEMENSGELNYKIHN